MNPVHGGFHHQPENVSMLKFLALSALASVSLIGLVQTTPAPVPPAPQTAAQPAAAQPGPAAQPAPGGLPASFRITGTAAPGGSFDVQAVGGVASGANVRWASPPVAAVQGRFVLWLDTTTNLWTLEIDSAQRSRTWGSVQQIAPGNFNLPFGRNRVIPLPQTDMQTIDVTVRP